MVVSPLPALSSQVVVDNSTNTPRFDYVIVGGGTCGFVLANQLSEDPGETVAVIEAGDSVFDNAKVKNTTTYGLCLGTSIDWQYSSAPQVYADNRTLVYSLGKALGGSSAINGMTFIRPESAQIDLWEQLGNKGWNWASLFENAKLSEHFVPPTSSQATLGATYKPSYHGYEGPVGVGWQTGLINGSAHSTFKDTWENLTLPSNQDPNGDKLRGFLFGLLPGRMTFGFR
ncbi:glucose-methanol-choline oxidoreductase [Crepidotus variabilis]|uniref:Glucose-methanol-choline oxidoreductase n=1 Tax=Crepidotus variabilis TaxID=179855 RepID=A0A9P6EFK5_9AGAR|nr:glucose-methanol-choline oxidoreductase [Crepidotus variabilis]